MDSGLVGLAKAVYQYGIYVVIGVISYFLKDYAAEVKKLKDDVSKLKVSQAVSESQIKDIREDIQNLATLIKEVERTIVADLKDIQKDLRDRNGINSR